MESVYDIVNIIILYVIFFIVFMGLSYIPVVAKYIKD